MSLPRKEHQSAARSRGKDVSQQEPNILALCTAHFGNTRPPSGVTPRPFPPRGVQKQALGGERHKPSKKPATRAARGPLRDPQTSVSSREITLVWKAEYPARCCGRTPCRPRRAPRDQARALGLHFAVGPGIAGIGSWLGGANSSPLAQQFAGVGLLAALRGEGRTPPSSRDHTPKPLRYTPTRSAASPDEAGEGSKPGTRDDAVAPPDAYRPLEPLAAFGEPAPAPVDAGPSTPELATLLAAALARRSNSSSLPPDLVPDDGDDTGSEAETEDEARLHDAVPKMPPPRPELSLHTTLAPAAGPHEPVTPTSPSLEAHEMDVDPEPVAQRTTEAPGAQKAVPYTPVRKRAAKPSFGLMTPPPSVVRL